MSKIKIDLDACIGCKKCVQICPTNVYEMKKKKPIVTNENACTFCGICADQCPKNVIEVEMRVDVGKYKIQVKAKEKYIEYSKELCKILGLKKSPVAVKLLANEDKVLEGVMPIDFPIRHCVSINIAAYGAGIYLPMEKHACAAAKTALGMAELPEKVKSGKIPYMHGLAASQKAAARIMNEIPKLPAGNTKGTILAPLEKTFFDPDVVILTVNPMQAMWIANAYLFKNGSPRITANFAGMQASCADATVIPYITKNVNFSVGCYGCRSMGKLGDDEMYIGIPIQQFDNVIQSLKGLQKAMRNLERGKA